MNGTASKYPIRVRSDLADSGVAKRVVRSSFLFRFLQFFFRQSTTPLTGLQLLCSGIVEELEVLTGVQIKSKALAFTDWLHIIRLTQSVLPEFDIALESTFLPNDGILPARGHKPTSLTSDTINNGPVAKILLPTVCDLLFEVRDNGVVINVR